MKLRDKKDLHTKTVSELKKLLKDAQEALLTLRLDKEQNKLTNTSSLPLKRREIAVLKTLLTQKSALEKVAEKKATEKKGVAVNG